jgi:hypothetical protein
MANLRRGWRKYDGFDHRLSNGRYRRYFAIGACIGKGPFATSTGQNV